MPRKFKPDTEPTRSNKLFVIGIALSLVIVSIAGITMWMQHLTRGGDGDPIPDFDVELENNSITLEYAPDAMLITPEPENNHEGNGVTTQSISTTFSDGFETGDESAWDSASSNAYASSLNPDSGSYSLRVNPTTHSVEYIKKEDIELCDDVVNLDFSAYITNQFVFGSADIQFFQHYDYFIVKLKFDGGKTLVYVLGGAYIGGPGEGVIDIRAQVDGKEVWSNIEIENIGNDYAAQFGDAMPDVVDLKFLVKSKCGKVYIDNVYLECETEPEPPVITNYWEHGDEQEVIAYFVVVEYNVDISPTINESNVFLEIKLWVTIVADGEDTLEDETLLQNAVIKVEDLGDVNWTSSTFSLPADNSDGDELTYTFDIWVSAFGQIANTSSWVEDNDKQVGFDSFSVEWTSYEVILLNAVIVGVVSSVGIVTTAVVSKKNKKKNPLDCVCKGEPDCKCDI